MRIWMICLAVLLVCLQAGAQGFARAEYFFDADPGAGNGTPIVISSVSDTVDFTANITTGSLLPGFHLLGIRVRHSSDDWGLYESKGFYLSVATADMGDLTAAEYFFDTDPGTGNGSPLSTGTSGQGVSFSAVIPLNTLPGGFHFLAIRTRDAGGIWGLYETRGFYISGLTSDMPDVTAAEYFFDTDPGTGNASALSIGTTGSAVSFSAIVPVNALPSGFHTLVIRTRDGNGNWGLYESRGFYISTFTADVADINAAEYFIDTDPGRGNGTVMSVGGTGGTLNFTAALPTSSLAPGFHLLAIRVKDADHNWGLYETRGFYISSSINDVTAIVAAEYFIDTDPGAGNGSTLSIGGPGDNITQVFNCPLPSGLANGSHIIGIRTKDADGNWGLYESDTFFIDNVLAVTGLELNAMKADNEVRLSWSTLSEQQTSSFVVERSKNGSDFKPIGEVLARGNANDKSLYTFPDTSPYDGMNFYRIREKGRDGSISYSNVTTVLFNNGGVAVQVYPNPAKEEVHIRLPEARTYWLQVHNGLGQMVQVGYRSDAGLLTLDVANFAAGNYHVRISDGVTIYATGFNKE